ncbi:MAG: sulfatase-like hydrolase/transferase [Actinomycetota bacterium]|nr:sulfatase-like hydrolase/transferase [Actinomycetota bacterium]
MASGDYKRQRLPARLRSILSGRDWVYLASLLVPLVLYNLVLKAIRIHAEEGFPGGFAAFALIRSDLLFNLGYVFLWVGLFALTRQSRWRWPVVVLFHAVTIIVVATTTSAHKYFLETGSTLSFSVIVYSLSKLGEIEDVIGSVTSLAVWGWVLVALGYMVAGPWTIVTLVFGKRGRSGSFGSASTARLFALGAFATSIGLIFLAVPVRAGEASKSFTWDPVVNVVMSEVEHAKIRDLVANATPMRTPEGTHLQRTPKTEKKNIVLIHLESARARSTTPYNKDLDTTPYLDKLAKHSLMAERAYTIVPHTSKAITAISCGIDPHLVREITEAEPGGIPARCLPELLKEQGYNTVWFSSATEDFEDRRALVKNFGYDDFYPVETMDTDGFQRSNYFGYEDDIMLQPSRDWLEQHKDKPFLATYLGVTGHHDYRPIDRYGLKHYSNFPPLDHYQNEIRYLDFFVKNLMEQYKELGLYDNTIFVIYGDHGEGFGEHDLFQHDNTIYQEGLKVPLIIHEPGRFENGKRVKRLTDQLDILPTLFDLLGYKVTGGHYPGRSLLAPPKKDRTLFFSCYDEYRCLASIHGTTKYIYFFGNQPDEVYDLASDPLEKHNIADEQSARELKHKREQVLAWYARVNAAYERRKPGQK